MDIQRRHSSWYEQILFNSVVKLALGFFAVVLFPAWLFLDVSHSYWQFGTVRANTFYANSAAYFVSAYFLARLQRFPGVQSFYMVLPTVITAWLLVLSALLLLREDYSRKIILLSFAIACVWAVFGYYIGRRFKRNKFALVPFGRAKNLVGLQGVDLRVLEAPSFDGIRFDGAVVDLHDSALPPEWERFLAYCTLAGVPVYHYKQVFESVTGRVNIEHLSENIFGELQPSPSYVFLKRLLDIVAVLAAAPVWIPVMLITGVIVKLESSGPMFFIQERVGQGNKSFRVYKLRSMTTDSEKHGAQFAQKNDARVTRVGKFIRKTRLDEFPQFINVLKGDMSIIGPRPEQRTFVEQFEKEIPFYSYRHIVKPGITGWAQVTQGYAADAEDTKVKIEHDFYYIKNFSIWLDILVVIKTIKTILTGFGAR